MFCSSCSCYSKFISSSIKRIKSYSSSLTNFTQYIDVNRMILLEDKPAAPDSSGFQIAFLNNLLARRDQNKQNTLRLSFEARPRGTPKHPFVPPKSEITHEIISSPEVYISELMKGNKRLLDGSPNRWTILLSGINPRGVRGATALEVLQGVMVLKRVLALNTTMPLTIKEFRVGRQIIFPTEQESFSMDESVLAELEATSVER